MAASPYVTAPTFAVPSAVWTAAHAAEQRDAIRAVPVVPVSPDAPLRKILLYLAHTRVRRIAAVLAVEVEVDADEVLRPEPLELVAVAALATVAGARLGVMADRAACLEVAEAALHRRI